ncbi:hypothetical protein PFISCL1PPCAC_5914 [Pristionchus fissidentatus]|uniref:Uncharacterized protein n=1 Tax=Pristionchus fissidentatus TaxID=1538716 RepID=A0AAV5V4W2_9BILA|nr:hypothetical protein PFISCL1PPCAC_5914 [Pristionchus fissidentatus]
MSFSHTLVSFTLYWLIPSCDMQSSNITETKKEPEKGGLQAFHIALIVVGIILIILLGIGGYIGYVKYMNYKINKNWNGGGVWNRQREKELTKAKKQEEERKQKMDKGAIEEEEKKDNEMWDQVDKMKKPVDGFTTSQLLNPK